MVTDSFLSGWIDSLSTHPIYLDVQTWELEQFTKRSQFVYNRMGGIYHEILPKSEYFSKALHTFHFAQNNLSVGYFTNKTTKHIEAYDPNPKERFTVAMQKLRGKLLQIGVVLVYSFCSLCSANAKNSVSFMRTSFRLEFCPLDLNMRKDKYLVADQIQVMT
ncbi:hypothetical protein TRIUR3_13474 [Triticum urartu]|uniref:Uncharacterized protein n=1 Tax=Triticum urartu TaxID=4572 RepID=M7ZYT2_TRIUA|nr:hypothetical protein TRIUR3_13474 [Triticum urartu]